MFCNQKKKIKIHILNTKIPIHTIVIMFSYSFWPIKYSLSIIHLQTLLFTPFIMNLQCYIQYIFNLSSNILRCCYTQFLILFSVHFVKGWMNVCGYQIQNKISQSWWTFEYVPNEHDLMLPPIILYGINTNKKC